MHFFLDHANLSTATSFGPDSANLTTKYNVTTQYTLSDQSKAFACQAGLIMVLPSDTANLVNVILQPIKGLSIPFPKIQFYVYKGLLRSSFIEDGDNGPAVRPKANSSDFITGLWTEHENSHLPAPTPAAFGFLPPPQNPTIEEILNHSFGQVTFRAVTEGQWIGDFGTSCGFEIIADTDHLLIDANYVRQAAQTFNVSQLPADSLQLRLEKEKILNYIDPAAFWGMHYQKGISIYDPTAPKKTPLATTALYTKIIEKHSTKNRVYFDIRNEHGYSYNFYQNYRPANKDEIIKINSTEATYPVDGWPLYRTDIVNQNKITLRIDDNTKPVLFVENPAVLGSINILNFLKTPALAGSSNEWGKDITLTFPKTGAHNVANYLRFQYFKTDDTTSPPTVVKSFVDSYLDSLFCIKPIPGLAATTKTVWMSNSKKTLANGFDFVHAAESGFYYDNTKVLLYAQIFGTALKSPKELYPKLAAGAPRTTDFIKNEYFPKNILINKWQMKEDATTTVDIMDLSAYDPATKTTPKEDLHFLGLTAAEYTSLLNTGGSSLLFEKKYVVLERVTPFTLKDLDSKPYRKYKLSVQLIDNNGQVTIASPGTNIFVYGSNSLLVASKGFLALHGGVPLNKFNLPDPGIIRQWDNAGIWNSSFTSLAMTLDPKQDTEGAKTPQPIRATTYYPADLKGVKSTTLDISKISAKATSYPLVVVVHGNGHRYTQYDAILKHLALNGFIASSIDIMDGWGSKNRVKILFNHLKHFIGSFGAKLTNSVGVTKSVGLLGHSRGGEAVVRAAKSILSDNSVNSIATITAIAALAPSDQNPPRVILEQPAPLFVLYGSMDGDITGGVIHYHRPSDDSRWGEDTIGSGFEIWDRANDQEKYMAFVHGATHNGFSTTNKDKSEPGIRNVIPEEPQKMIVAGYMNAFFRKGQLNEPTWEDIFKGNLIPKSAATDRIYQQYQKPVVVSPNPPLMMMLQDYQLAPDDMITSDGIVVNNLKVLDIHSPHETRGLKVFLKTTQEFTLDISSTDSTSFTYLSFRITKRQLDTGMPDLTNLFVKIANAGGSQSKSLEVRNYRVIPTPDFRDIKSTTKKTYSALSVDRSFKIVTDATLIYSNSTTSSLLPTGYAVAKAAGFTHGGSVPLTNSSFLSVSIPGTLTDGTAITVTSIIPVGSKVEISTIERRYFTKSAMITVLMDLNDFDLADRSQINKIIFNYLSNVGEVEIDSIQFTK